MSKTVNRTPGHLSQVGSDERIDNFNLVSFEGITNSENDLTVSPSTFIDANNMYINSNDILSSRPTIKSTKYLDQDFIDLEGVKNTWVVDDLLIYHKGTKLKFIKNKVPYDIEIEVGNTVNVLESMENYLLVYPANIYIDVSTKNEEGVLLFKHGSIYDISYIPTTELRSGNQVTQPEKPNKISPYSKHSIIYDKEVYTDLSELYGKKVEVLVGDETYNINSYQENTINTIQDVLAIENFDYVKYSNKNSAIGYKDGNIYYAPDGKNFAPLPTVPGSTIIQTNGSTVVGMPKFVGEAFITEEGDACFVIGADHIYAISLVESDWDATSNMFVKRWSNWTMLDWDTNYSKLTWTDSTGDNDGKMTSSDAIMTGDAPVRLNLVNMTKPDDPRPNYYTKNYGRLLNENTFVIIMYAGDLDEPLGQDGNPSNQIKPTIFVYNRQVDASKVHIYQITNAEDLRIYPIPNTTSAYNTVASLVGGDFDLHGYVMMISLAFRYSTSRDVTAGTAVTNSCICSFDIQVDTSGSYTFVCGKEIPISSTMTGMTINLNGYIPIIGDLKINYSSYLSNSDTSLLTANVNLTYTNPTNVMHIITRKYTVQDSNNSSTKTLNIKANGEINFIGIQTFSVMMSRSSLRIATSKGMLVTNNDLLEYRFIPYLVSESMRPVYIDEDTLITQKVETIVCGLKSIHSRQRLDFDYTDEQLEILKRALSIRITESTATLVTIDNKDSLGIVPGITPYSNSPTTQPVYQANLPDTTAGYIGKYVWKFTILAYTNKLYTTDNIVATFSTIVEDTNFELPDIRVSAKLVDLYFGSGRNLYIGKVMYDKNEKASLYFSEGLWEEFEETIFQLQILSRNTLGVYCRDSIWIVYSDDNGIYYKSKSKITNSCREGDMVTLSIDGKGSLYPCHRGIAYIEHQSLLSIEEQQLDFISDAVQTYIVDWIKDKPIRMFNYEFWLYIYSREDNVIWIMDLRNNHWWKWTTPYPIYNMFVYLNELYILSNNNICKFVEDEEYYDIMDYTEDNRWNKRVIPWSFESQRLYIKDINRYKHIYNMIINTRIPDESTKEVSLRLACLVYRTSISRIPDEVLEYKVSGIRSYVKRLRIFKCNFFKFRISSDTENNIEDSNYNQRQMKIEGITLKYGIRERIR